MTVLVDHGHPISGNTAGRPTNCEPGEKYFDTDLNQWLVYNGTAWQLGGGNAPGVLTVNAAGSVITNAAALATGFTWVQGADNTKGVKLPVMLAGQVCEVQNDPAANRILKVYPQVNGAINALGANTAISMAANTSARFVAYNAAQAYTIPAIPS